MSELCEESEQKLTSGLPEAGKLKLPSRKLHLEDYIGNFQADRVEKRRKKKLKEEL